MKASVNLFFKDGNRRMLAFMSAGCRNDKVIVFHP